MRRVEIAGEIVHRQLPRWGQVVMLGVSLSGAVGLVAVFWERLRRWPAGREPGTRRGVGAEHIDAGYALTGWWLYAHTPSGTPSRGREPDVRSRIDWKYVLCLELTDPGFGGRALFVKILAHWLLRTPGGPQNPGNHIKRGGFDPSMCLLHYPSCIGFFKITQYLA
jgi:hypothetical protein